MSQQIKTKAQLNALIAKLKKGSPEVAAKVAARVAPVLSSLAQKAFDGRRSPNGDPWPEGIDLNETGKLREKALQYTAHGTKVTANVNDPRYAKYQLKHGLLPRAGSLPDDWDAAVTRIADDELARSVRAL